MLAVKVEVFASSFKFHRAVVTDWGELSGHWATVLRLHAKLELEFISQLLLPHRAFKKMRRAQRGAFFCNASSDMVDATVGGFPFPAKKNGASPETLRCGGWSPLYERSGLSIEVLGCAKVRVYSSVLQV